MPDRPDIITHCGNYHVFPDVGGVLPLRAMGGWPPNEVQKAADGVDYI